MPAPSHSRIPELHGHRGCRGLRPENTLPSLLHALALGVDVLEMDVIISADYQVVVSHEPWLNPAICLDLEGQPIESSPTPRFNLYQMPYATIRQCDCGLRRHPAFPEQVSEPAHKPLLREVLAAAEVVARPAGRPPIRYAIEIKSAPDGDNIFHPTPDYFLSLVLAEINKARVSARATVLCFDPRILRLAHQRQPDLATCLLLEADQPWLASIQALGFVPTTLGPDFATVTAASVQQVRSLYPSLRLVPWTVNQPADMMQLIALGVDGITTDYPDRFLALTIG
ncbi:glycerophosphodiester phosphodiesterase family protein [Hymenobacter siberiensis]|uniref:glycerophosphodiester phosphodiesterase family protein n=1 Tax=Hymenobacter siberiensis TaxID=2848396 RepID=UPI001C1DD78A|nr:glycerophosphodiester phosphodiesterase family protein [Hymenobacter siberiensis]MBU6119800.1 glycerophosphodiester phosphodiesterase [Hymenobacter siberiensis]